jgi:toxin-antitoxin system PIN domain toxin
LTAQLCDANVWIALAVAEHEFHALATSWFGTVVAPQSVFFCRTTQQGFLRLLTNPAVFAGYGLPGLTNREAWAAYEALMADERIAFADEPRDIERLWRDFGARRTAAQKLWTDAYLAAFALAGGMQFVTTDRAFRQFRGLDLLLLGNA